MVKKTKIIRFIVLFLLVLGGYPFIQKSNADDIKEDVTFFSGYQDIPVMNGLVELDNQSFTFDKPEGDITEIVALLNGVNDSQVIEHYQAILPQFGWGIVDGVRYYRKGTYLDISFEQVDEHEIVRIMIRPSR